MIVKKEMRGPSRTGFAWAAMGALALFALAGCGGGGGGASTAPTVSQVSLQGTAAVGSPLAGANITVIDAKGATATTTADASGNYTISVTGMTAPLVILASDPQGVASTQVSVLAALTSGSATNIVNVTTLTTAVSAWLTSSGNPSDLASSSSTLAAVTPASVAAAVANLKSALSAILAANGVSAASFDPIGAPFTANHTGLDGVIDSIQVINDPSGGVDLISTADPSTSIPLKNGASSPTTLPAPPAVGDYLGPLASALSQCLAGTTSACGTAIDASYLENGFSTFASAHAGIATSGATVFAPRTLEFFKRNTTQEALIEVPYKLPSGMFGTIVTVVQKLGNGNWDIIGNQQPFDVSISSFLERRQFLDASEVQFGRYESGLTISVPAGAAGTPNPTTLASVGVTGPGINGTAFLVPRSGVGNSTFGLTSTAQAQPPVGGATTSSNTSLYRWSWLALGGSANATFTPGAGGLGFYTPAPIDVSQVPAFATYTVTFYDSTGTAIGQSFSVVNPTPSLAASAGRGVFWQDLTADTVANVLTPGGSLAGVQAAPTLSWSNLVNGAPLAPLVTQAQIQASPGTGVGGSEVDGWWNGPASFAASGSYSAAVTAGVAQSGVQQCNSACAFPALQAGASRLVQLNWSFGRMQFFNIWRYND